MTDDLSPNQAEENKEPLSPEETAQNQQMPNVSNPNASPPNTPNLNTPSPNVQDRNLQPQSVPASGEQTVSPLLPPSEAPLPPTVILPGEQEEKSSSKELGFSLSEDNFEIYTRETVDSEKPPLDIQPEKADVIDPNSLRAQFQATGRIPIGTKLGHFTVTKYIGGGGMGRVYEGIDTALDRKVAIKILPRQRTEDSGAVARFLNEARSAARLNHEHIAQVYFCGESEGIPFIAFEYVEGINVRSYVEANGPIPLDEGINFLLQIAGALAHAALHGVTHRDVKPSNILITPQGKAKLIDMGLARLLRSDPQEDLTVSGVTLGTFDYISPEQARDPRVADVRSDIYSLGCTFFFMLTGQPPFPEGTVLQKLLKHQGDDPPDIRMLVPGTPDEVSDLILKMMAKDPADRFQSPDELSQALAVLARKIGLHPAEPEKRPSLRFRRAAPRIDIKRHLPWCTAVGLLLLCVAGIRFFSQSSDEAAILPEWNSSGRGIPTSASSSAAPVLSENTVPVLASKRGVMTRLIGSVPHNEVLPVLSAEYPIRTVSDSGVDRSPVRSGLGAVPLDLAQTLTDPSLLNESESIIGSLRRTISVTASELSGEWSLARDQTERPEEAPNQTEETGPAAVVDQVGGKPNIFASLNEALQYTAEQTKSSAGEVVIELAYEGTEEVRPFSLTGQNIRLAAQSGFKPRIAFVPKNAPARSSMTDLTDSRLTLDGVEIDFSVPASSDKPDCWSLFTLAGTTALVIKNSTITIQDTSPSPAESSAESENKNLYRAAFCRVIPAANLATNSAPEKPFSEIPLSSGDSSDKSNPAGVKIDLTRVFARGEAVFCSAKSNTRTEISIVSAGFGLNSPLIAQSGTGTVSLTMDRALGFFRTPFLSILPPAEIGSIQTILKNTLLLIDHQPLARLLVTVPPAEIPAPDWKLADSIICRSAALLQASSTQQPDYRVELPAASPSFWSDTDDDPMMDRLFELPPHRISIVELGENLFRPVYLKTHTPNEKNILEAIESGILPNSKPSVD